MKFIVDGTLAPDAILPGKCFSLQLAQVSHLLLRFYVSRIIIKGLARLSWQITADA